MNLIRMAEEQGEVEAMVERAILARMSNNDPMREELGTLRDRVAYLESRLREARVEVGRLTRMLDYSQQVSEAKGQEHEDAAQKLLARLRAAHQSNDTVHELLDQVEQQERLIDSLRAQLVEARLAAPEEFRRQIEEGEQLRMVQRSLLNRMREERDALREELEDLRREGRGT